MALLDRENFGFSLESCHTLGVTDEGLLTSRA
jgi:hypothetical protein